MEPENSVLDSLRKAVEAMPDDVPLRLHLATLLLQAGQRDEAVRQLGAVLQRDPGNTDALTLLQAERPVVPETAPVPGGFDWTQAEDELRDVMPAMFIGEPEDAGAYDPEHAGLTLADVAGMTEVKQRLEAAFLAPMRNPDLRKLYGKSLRGGLLLYGPPGCGKTFIARAVAGELGAKFISVSFADIIDMFVGQSERNIHQLFEHARPVGPDAARAATGRARARGRVQAAPAGPAGGRDRPGETGQPDRRLFRCGHRAHLRIRGRDRAA